MTVTDIGAICFGIIVGWVTSRTLRRTTPSGLTDIATVTGSIGGAAITGIWQPSTNAFGYYCIGLFIGFFGYLILAMTMARKSGEPIGDSLGSEPVPTTTASATPSTT